MLLDLSVRPVATAVNLLSLPESLGKRLERMEDVSSPYEPRVNLERLAALEPDRVFTPGYEYAYASTEQVRANMAELGRALKDSTATPFTSTSTPTARRSTSSSRPTPLGPTLDGVRNGQVCVVDSGAWNGVPVPAAHVILDDIETT